MRLCRSVESEVWGWTNEDEDWMVCLWQMVPGDFDTSMAVDTNNQHAAVSSSYAVPHLCDVMHAHPSPEGLWAHLILGSNHREQRSQTMDSLRCRRTVNFLISPLSSVSICHFSFPFYFESLDCRTDSGRRWAILLRWNSDHFGRTQNIGAHTAIRL